MKNSKKNFLVNLNTVYSEKKDRLKTKITKILTDAFLKYPQNQMCYNKYNKAKSFENENFRRK